MILSTRTRREYDATPVRCDGVGYGRIGGVPHAMFVLTANVGDEAQTVTVALEVENARFTRTALDLALTEHDHMTTETN